MKEKNVIISLDYSSKRCCQIIFSRLFKIQAFIRRIVSSKINISG